MQSIETILFIVLLSFFMGQSSFSASGEEEGSPAASTGESEMAKKWRAKYAELSSLKGRINDIESQLDKLFDAQQNLQKEDPERLAQIKKTHKELNEKVEKYQELYRELKYRFPGRGESLERAYVPLKKQNLEEHKSETGLRVLLRRVKTKIDEKYHRAMVEAAKEDSQKINEGSSDYIPPQRQKPLEERKLKLER